MGDRTSGVAIADMNLFSSVLVGGWEEKGAKD